MTRRLILIFGGVLVGVILLMAILREEPVAPSQPSSETDRRDLVGKVSDNLTIQAFVDSYRQALLSQDPTWMLRHFPANGDGSLVLYYGKRMSVEALGETLSASAATGPVTIHGVNMQNLLSIDSPRYRCPAHILTLGLDVETKTQRRMKEIRLYVLEPEPGKFAILAENNVPAPPPPGQAREFAKRVSQALLAQQPDLLVSLYPDLFSGAKIRYYENERKITWIYADLVESRIAEPLEVQRASVLSCSDLITSPEGHEYYNLRIGLVFRTDAAETWRKKELVILFARQGNENFEVFLEENAIP